MSIENLTKALIKLYPNGHAFRLFRETWKNLNIGLLTEGTRITTFFQNVRDSGIPGRLPSEALADWEELFLLQDNAPLSDAERNQRIKSRFNAVGGQGTDYLEDIFNEQFDLLLFGTYTIYDTRCGDGVSTCGNPVSTCGNATVLPTPPDNAITIYENFYVYDPSAVDGTVIIKSLTDSPSEFPSDPDYWPLVWFISGPDGLGSWLNLPINRKDEFIETVLKYKPTHTWVIAQINFV